MTSAIFDANTEETKKAWINPVFVGYEPKLRLWTLRILCELGVVWDSDFATQRFVDDTAPLLDVPNEIDEPLSLIGHYRSLLEKHELQSAAVSGVLAQNLSILGRGLRLSDGEQDLLAFLLLYQSLSWFEHVVDLAIGQSDMHRITWRLSTVLGISHEEMQRILKPSSMIHAAGLVEISEGGRCMPLNMVLDTNSSLMRLLTQTDFNLQQLLRQTARACRKSHLRLSDFDHMVAERDLLVRYLKGVRRERIRPATILLDGPPGVGKTELVRLLASELKFDAWEVNELDADGNAALPGERLAFLRICQRLVERNRNSLVIFDEADALLGGEPGYHRRGASASKAALIHYLENLDVPVIWIVNHGDLIEPAILRRMDLHIRFGRLPAQTRKEMLQKVLKCSSTESEWVERLSRQQRVTPARIAQADKVASLIADKNADDHGMLVRKVLEVNLGLEPDRQGDIHLKKFELPYRLDMINADEDLSALLDALKSSPQARLCLYGPPGTGKTRFVRHLAESCGLKLAEYRASDLLDRYVGGSEQNIRRMFDDSDRPDTLLLLDEADSLIADRARAQQNWEVNKVNELLKGLENFCGLFVASTNLMDRLDPAVMRRLDFKIHFDWLKPDQRWRLFLDLARHASLRVAGAQARKLRQRLDRMECLTPGDFAMLARRLTIRPALKSGQELADLLERETRHKPEASQSRGIGFTASV